MGEKGRLNRLVLDTNVLVSALLFDGPSSRFVDLWQSGGIRLLLSAAILKEYGRVLGYPKFGLSEREAAELLGEEVLPFVEPVRVGRVARVVPEDPADDEFLACAEAGAADAVVSGDKHLLRLGKHAGIPILTVRDCLAAFS